MTGSAIAHERCRQAENKHTSFLTNPRGKNQCLNVGLSSPQLHCVQGAVTIFCVRVFVNVLLDMHVHI